MRNLLPMAVLVSAFLLTGCNVNAFYKEDTGVIEPVAAPNPAFVPIAFDDDGADTPVNPLAGDPLTGDGVPEILAGEGPDAIQPLDDFAADAGPEVVETYVVEKGDTLGHISQKLFGTVGRTKDLMSANPGINPTRMQIGDVINVPR